MWSLFGIFLLAAQHVSSSTVLPPSQDPWYTVPSDISSYKPGETIRTRKISNLLEPFLPSNAAISVQEAHQYIYRTTDNLGNAAAAATTILIPHKADPTKLLSYQAAYDSQNVDCSPSFTLQAGSSTGGIGGILLPNSTLSVDMPFVSIQNGETLDWPLTIV
jgi:hypothetical protein